MKLLISPMAQSDLIEIGDYIALDNPNRALTFVAEIESQLSKLKDHPSLGRPRPEVHAELRSLSYEHYVIFYSVSGVEIRIERVLHGARKITDIFDG